MIVIFMLSITPNSDGNDIHVVDYAQQCIIRFTDSILLISSLTIKRDESCSRWRGRHSPPPPATIGPSDVCGNGGSLLSGVE